MLYKINNMMYYIFSKSKLLVVVFLIANCGLAQNMVFQTSQNYNLRAETLKVVNYHNSKKNVNTTYPLKIDSNIFNSRNVTFRIKGKVFSARFIKKNVRTKNDFTWFGKTSEGQGVFFYVKNGKIASKFSAGGYAYTLIPTKTGHVLVEYNNTDVGECGTKNTISKKLINQSKKKERKTFVDTDCTLRVLIATTPAGVQEITNAGFADVPTFAQVAVDEANQAYLSSDIDLTMELAVIVNTNYTESTDDDSMDTDVDNFRNGTGDLAVTHTQRDLFQTDIQVLIRPSEGSLYGIAHVVSDDDPLEEEDMFCAVSIEGVTTGRFTFTHEIGHLMGARHDNHNDTPNYARGFVSGTTRGDWRTIMATSKVVGCGSSDGCRIGQFSNPNLRHNGAAIGTTTRDNARMIREKINEIRNLREVPNNLTFTSTVGVPLGNFLAHNEIDTNGQLFIVIRDSQVTMRAGRKITLRNDVWVNNGGTLRIFIDENACETPPSTINASDEGSNLSNNRIDSELVSGFIYPNPTTGDVNIKFSENINETVKIDVNDILGRSVYNTKTYIDGQNLKLDLNDQPNGIYFLNIKGEEETYRFKVYISK